MVEEKAAKESGMIKSKPICGIVMPISALDGCDENHWSSVLAILNESISKTEFEPNLVSSSDDIGVIQKRIVQNLYENPIVVCDISGRNPNVMFELGMRLAFDKPTIVIKDDKTPYNFDTSPIEHISYPRDLRYQRIVEFKEELARKIIATSKAATADKEYSTFLKHFGTFSVVKLDSKEFGPNEFIAEELREIKSQLATFRHISRTDNKLIELSRSSDESELGELISRTRKIVRRERMKLRAAGTSETEAKKAILEMVEHQIDAPMYFRTSHSFRAFFDALY